MIVSLNQNLWLFDWFRECYSTNFEKFLDNLNDRYTRDFFANNSARKIMRDFLETQGFTAKLTTTQDILISITEEEFVFLKLKYS